MPWSKTREVYEQDSDLAPSTYLRIFQQAKDVLERLSKKAIINSSGNAEVIVIALPDCNVKSGSVNAFRRTWLQPPFCDAVYPQRGPALLSAVPMRAIVLGGEHEVHRAAAGVLESQTSQTYYKVVILAFYSKAPNLVQAKAHALQLAQSLGLPWVCIGDHDATADEPVDIFATGAAYNWDEGFGPLPPTCTGSRRIDFAFSQGLYPEGIEHAHGFADHLAVTYHVQVEDLPISVRRRAPIGPVEDLQHKIFDWHTFSRWHKHQEFDNMAQHLVDFLGYRPNGGECLEQHRDVGHSASLQAEGVQLRRHRRLLRRLRQLSIYGPQGGLVANINRNYSDLARHFDVLARLPDAVPLYKSWQHRKLRSGSCASPTGGGALNRLPKPADGCVCMQSALLLPLP